MKRFILCLVTLLMTFGFFVVSYAAEVKLTAMDAAASDLFGQSVSISGDYAIVGAFGDDDAGHLSGSAYIFIRSGETWSEQAKITASDAAAGDRFGGSVFISGDYAIVGASGDDDAGEDSGSAYIYHSRDDLSLPVELSVYTMTAWGHVKQTALLQNYPNPFNPETWIPYDLATNAEVTITIYDASGESIRRLRLGRKPAGSYLTRDKAAYWNGLSDIDERVSSGIYYYHLRAGDYSATKKMIILK